MHTSTAALRSWAWKFERLISRQWQLFNSLAKLGLFLVVNLLQFDVSALRCSKCCSLSYRSSRGFTWHVHNLEVLIQHYILLQPELLFLMKPACTVSWFVPRRQLWRAYIRVFYFLRSGHLLCQPWRPLLLQFHLDVIDNSCTMLFISVLCLLLMGPKSAFCSWEFGKYVPFFLDRRCSLSISILFLLVSSELDYGSICGSQLLHLLGLLGRQNLAFRMCLLRF